MSNDVTIVCFLGGACGDIVTAIIDSTSATVDIDGRIILPKDRSKLKDLNNFNNDDEKDQMIENIKYKSISSHDYKYHFIKRHSILYIGIFDTKMAMWAATRFKRLHPGSWTDLNCQSIESHAIQYIEHTNMVSNNKKIKVLDIQDIISGKLIKKLKEFGFEIDELSNTLYSTWLNANNLKDN
jgi:hypothetical protein